MSLIGYTVEQMRRAAAAWRLADNGRNETVHDKIDDLIGEVARVRKANEELIAQAQQPAPPAIQHQHRHHIHIQDPEAVALIRVLKTELERSIMGIHEEIARITADVAAEKSAAAAATLALQSYAKQVADLTAQIQSAAIEGDVTTLKAAADSLEQTTAALTSAAPTVASAVVENTPAAPATTDTPTTQTVATGSDTQAAGTATQ